MRLRSIKNADDIISNSKYIILNPKDYKGKWQELFGNNNKIYIEIGMGKGKFIKENAFTNPNINYIGIEKFDNIIARSIKKIENINLNNLKLVRMDALEIDKVFNKEIDTIYLNFSDPWPKDGHEKRRLTSNSFLTKYDNIFKNGNRIIMKTDNQNLFEYSLKSLVNYGYKIISLSFDLHNSSNKNIITTEYEDKFVSKGTKIYFCIFEKSK